MKWLGVRSLRFVVSLCVTMSVHLKNKLTSNPQSRRLKGNSTYFTQEVLLMMSEWCHQARRLQTNIQSVLLKGGQLHDGKCRSILYFIVLSPLVSVICLMTHCPPPSSAPQRGYELWPSPAEWGVVWESWGWRRPCSENGWLDPEWENSTNWASPELHPSPLHQTVSVVTNNSTNEWRVDLMSLI